MKIQKPKCRLKVTLRCNMKCEYCINKSTEYRKKWKFIMDCREIFQNPGDKWLDFEKYRSIVISGGEPLYGIEEAKLIEVLETLRSNTFCPIYLQTNGTCLEKEFVKKVDNYIDGIGISVHDWDVFLNLKTRYVDILKIKPIRLYIQDTDYNSDMFVKNRIRIDFTKVRWWKDGEFDTSEEIYCMGE